MDLYHDHIQQKVNITAGSIVFLFILEIEQIPQEGEGIIDFIWLDIYVLLHFSLFSGFPGVARHSQHIGKKTCHPRNSSTILERSSETEAKSIHCKTCIGAETVNPPGTLAFTLDF